MVRRLVLVLLAVATGVQALPTANDDSVSGTEETPLLVEVLADNGSGADTESTGRALTVTTVSNPSSGTAVIGANNTVTYTPELNFAGTDSFTYTIEDPDGNEATATVTVTVANTADRPIITAVTLPAGGIIEDSVDNVIQFEAFDPDPDDEIVAFRVVYTSENFAMEQADGTPIPRGVFVDIAGDSVVIASLRENFSGDVIFSVSALSKATPSDPTDHESIERFEIIPVVPVNDPPEVLPAAASFDEGTTGTAILRWRDPDGDLAVRGRLVSVPSELEVRELNDGVPGDLLAAGDLFDGLSLHIAYTGPPLTFGDPAANFEATYTVFDENDAESTTAAPIFVEVLPAFMRLSVDGLPSSINIVQDPANPTYLAQLVGFPADAGIFYPETSLPAGVNGTVESCGVFFNGECFSWNHPIPAATPIIPLLPGSDEGMVFRFTPTDPGFVGSETIHYRISRDLELNLPAAYSEVGSFTINIIPPPTPAELALQAWADSFGLMGDGAEPEGNPSGDGVNNLLKFASNRSPLDNDPGGLFTIERIRVGEQPTLRVTFLRRRDGLVIYTPARNRTLAPGDWMAFTATPTTSPIDADWETVTYEEPVSGSDASAQFVEIRVQLAPAAP